MIRAYSFKALSVFQSLTTGTRVGPLQMWFDKRLPKNRINLLLEAGPEGNFVVRDSASNPGCFAFSYIVEGKVQHKLIEENDAGFHLKACDEVSTSSYDQAYDQAITRLPDAHFSVGSSSRISIIPWADFMTGPGVTLCDLLQALILNLF